MDNIQLETESLRSELHAQLMKALEPIFKANRERVGVA